MSTGFLITNLTGKLKSIREVVNRHVFKKLYIYISVNSKQKSLSSNDWVSKQIVNMYSSSFYLFPHLDVRIILNELKILEEKVTRIKDYNVDIILVPKNYEKKVSSLQDGKKNLPVVYIDDFSEEEENFSAIENKKFKNVVLGGTFDRLHTGHKILLSEAILRCSEKLTVGVTDGDMIKGKKLWELIEPCQKRITAIEEFIKEVDSSIVYEVIPITDMFGPTKNDPNMNMIVVSAETHKGGLKVNEIRKQNNLNELEVYIVPLAEDSNKMGEEEEKISSSNTRMRLLGTYLKIPEPNPYLPHKPYIIGLTGGIASGKSNICKYLLELGAAIIDCDKVGHKLYKQGTAIYNKLIQTFGDQIVGPNGEINRKELGAIVFNNHEKLQTLNSLIWPAILQATMDETQRLYTEEKKDIVILEAAILLKACWEKNVHEIWASIIPESEAVKRLINRNNLSEEEAKLRVNVQVSNTDIVEKANIIFCSLWSYEFTKQQVTKAWETLKSRI